MRDPLLAEVEFRLGARHVTVSWAGPGTTPHAAAVYGHLAALLAQHGFSRALFDLRQRAPLAPDTARWVVTEGFALLQAAARHAPLRLAYVLAATECEQWPACQRQTLNELVRIGVFATVAEAESWLLTDVVASHTA